MIRKSSALVATAAIGFVILPGAMAVTMGAIGAESQTICHGDSSFKTWLPPVKVTGTKFNRRGFGEVIVKVLSDRLPVA
jgi:hypothetical protein